MILSCNYYIVNLGITAESPSPFEGRAGERLFLLLMTATSLSLGCTRDISPQEGRTPRFCSIIYPLLREYAFIVRVLDHFHFSDQVAEF